MYAPIKRRKKLQQGAKLIYKDITKNSIYKIKNHEIKENLCHATYPITYQNNYQILQNKAVVLITWGKHVNK